MDYGNVRWHQMCPRLTVCGGRSGARTGRPSSRRAVIYAAVVATKATRTCSAFYYFSTFTCAAVVPYRAMVLAVHRRKTGASNCDKDLKNSRLARSRASFLPPFAWHFILLLCTRKYLKIQTSLVQQQLKNEGNKKVELNNLMSS